MESEDIAKLMAVKDDPVPCVLLKPDGSVEEPVVDMTPSKGACLSALRGCGIARPAPAPVCATPARNGLTRAVARRRGGARLAGRAGHHLRPVRAGGPRRAERRGAHPPTAPPASHLIVHPESRLSPPARVAVQIVTVADPPPDAADNEHVLPQPFAVRDTSRSPFKPPVRFSTFASCARTGLKVQGLDPAVPQR